jgi:hypothetical protein
METRPPCLCVRPLAHRPFMQAGQSVGNWMPSAARVRDPRSVDGSQAFGTT